MNSKNNCDMCGETEITQYLNWGEDWLDFEEDLSTYKTIFVNENTYQALCDDCFDKRMKMTKKEGTTND